MAILVSVSLAVHAGTSKPLKDFRRNIRGQLEFKGLSSIHDLKGRPALYPLPGLSGCMGNEGFDRTEGLPLWIPMISMETPSMVII